MHNRYAAHAPPYDDATPDDDASSHGDDANGQSDDANGQPDDANGTPYDDAIPYDVQATGVDGTTLATWLRDTSLEKQVNVADHCRRVHHIISGTNL